MSVRLPGAVLALEVGSSVMFDAVVTTSLGVMFVFSIVLGGGIDSPSRDAACCRCGWVRDIMCMRDIWLERGSAECFVSGKLFLHYLYQMFEFDLLPSK